MPRARRERAPSPPDHSQLPHRVGGGVDADSEYDDNSDPSWENEGDSGESAESAGSAESGESAESAESAESGESGESAESAESAESENDDSDDEAPPCKRPRV